jgi:membrane-anchored glycerophosphoryl diester phosphodiesterase (GDPDase)
MAIEQHSSTYENRPYDFDIIELTKEGRRRMEGVKGVFVAAFAIYILTAVIMQTALSVIFPSPAENPDFANQTIVTILSYPVLIPMLTGMIMMAIRHVRGETIMYKDIFGYYTMTWTLALAALLIYMMTVVGLMLLILPGIYLSVAYIFTLPLIADKGMGIWDAMERSRKRGTQHWFKGFGLMILLSLGLMVGFLSFGIGLVWAVPLMLITLYGLLYPIMFE